MGRPYLKRKLFYYSLLKRSSLREKDKKDLAAVAATILHEKSRRVDAIFYMQGDSFDRLPKTVQLFKKGYSNTIVLSGNDTNPQRAVPACLIIERLVKYNIPPSVIIHESKSQHTLDQAREGIKLALKRKWKNIILVTSPYHQIRCFLTFLSEAKRQKAEKKIKIWNQSANISWQSKRKLRMGKTQKELILEEAEKIKKYQAKKFGALIKPIEGLKYLKLRRK